MAPSQKQLQRDIKKIETHIRRSLGGCKDSTVELLVREVLPYHLYCASLGMFDSIGHAARDLGGSIRLATESAKGG
jgi:hypothetical protein